MRKPDLIDLSVGEIMSHWPTTIRVFLDHHMLCVGCPIAPFHTLVDAAEEHGIAFGGLLSDIEEEVEREMLTDSPVSAHHR